MLRLRASTAGLIGFGRLPQTLRRAAAFGFSVVGYDPHVSESYMRSFGVHKV